METALLSFYESILKPFISQLATGTLNTSNYPKSYKGLKVQVSFGKGNLARIPWIALLGDGDTVQTGIYPVLLYYTKVKILVLAYGISETNKPNRDWPVSGVQTIAEYFAQLSLDKPDRYGQSLVYQVYHDVDKLDRSVVDKDIDDLCSVYRTTLNPKAMRVYSLDVTSFIKDKKQTGVIMPTALSVRFVASLLAKPFVILTGLSGSGKTLLAHSFVKWISEHESQYRLVSVGADWTNREPLLGFPNALDESSYVKPDNGVIDLLLSAQQNPTKPHFLILDEMNLSHVERYFADFLSVMESGDTIKLHSGHEMKSGVPPKVAIPKNLYVIGTVNIDETTYMFSPKVLDRANVIEFRIEYDDMKAYLSKAGAIALADIEGKGSQFAASFVMISNELDARDQRTDSVAQIMLLFFDQLKVLGAEYGYRTAAEIFRFASAVSKLDDGFTANQIADMAIVQKLLPKVHGSRRKVTGPLTTLKKLCEENELPLSLEKITRMIRNSEDNGFTSFAES